MEIPIEKIKQKEVKNTILKKSTKPKHLALISSLETSFKSYLQNVLNLSYSYSKQ